MNDDTKFEVNDKPPALVRSGWLPAKERSPLRKLADSNPGAWVSERFATKKEAESARSRFGGKKTTGEKYETRIAWAGLDGGWKLYVRLARMGKVSFPLRLR